MAMHTSAIKTSQWESRAPSAGYSYPGCLQRNQLLAALPGPEWERLLPHLEPVELPLGKVLHEAGDGLAHVYFPTTAIVSLMIVLSDGRSTEFAVVGSEGMVGYSLFLGATSTQSRAVVQAAGRGYRLKAKLMTLQLQQPGALMHLVLRYTHALMTQVAQKEMCNRHHSLDQQLCQWLLLRLDRLHSNELTVTQEGIASMLGVRREGVTEAAGHLQQAGFIRYQRGHITVLDRTGLERRTCECYALIRREYDRLIPPFTALKCECRTGQHPDRRSRQQQVPQLHLAR